MLLELYIQNCALVKSARLTLDKGLNILTGETGSGKSIIIEALGLCLGERADKSFVRKGYEKGVVEAIFYTENENIKEELLEYGIDFETNENLTITREIYADGKSISRINGRSVKVSFLRKISSLLIDIHSQHQNQLLLNKDNHLRFLDMYGYKDLKDIKQEYKKIYDEYILLKSELSRLTENKDDKEIQREVDILQFQIKEIEQADLKQEEYDQLLKEREIYRNSEKIYNVLSDCYNSIYGDNINAFDLISKNLKEFRNTCSFDNKLEQIYEQLEEITYKITDVSNDIRLYKDNLNLSSLDIEYIEGRIDTINNLKRKYGNTIDEIFCYKDKIKSRLEEIINKDEKINSLKEKINLVEKDLNIKSDLITQKRKQVSEKLKKDLLDELKSLNIKNALFDVKFIKKEEFSSNGKDDVEFLVSFNEGEDLKPIQKVASGGELSRFMLAFKKILLSAEKINTLVFDEIDTGISGITAQIVGEKLKDMSSIKQIICITHLPQIAVQGDTHFCIEKVVEENRTYTNINKLSKEEKIKEIARLIGGLNITETTIKSAKEIIELAKG
ncbi:DNA replication and repair protein RecN [Alkalithermobacter thermoalcaliphilus JW-YL-7 = DSM 7308]|uniref:DNA repair protein RecN n=1 Tax=Alkalithermobacter thermoalcaliphilus JW-YL-7 = DSM 7308 TaxID=1121328 RepID=A0A150FPU7_CLOPD|nr:DNA repair protein RecN [[Clostridium] paradoxum JW-YL-7 = DSM 7308]SHK65974.1 DNA replication and repair protein RecN [[Clostridium] paradoxum JW-YL-7 = DSM 7308]